MSQKFTSTIAGASIFISLIGVLSRGFGFIREMIFANNFGTGTQFDLYLVGAVLPVTINTIILFIGQNYFVPIFQKLKATESYESVQNKYNQAFLLFICAGIILAAILFFLNDFIIDLYMIGASATSRDIAIIVFNIFLITVPFSAGISMLSALLQTMYEFKYPAISILFLNISIIIVLILFTDRFGIFVIPIGYLIGTLLQFFYLIYKSHNYFKIRLLNSFSKGIALQSFFGTSLFTILLIESIGQLYVILDRYFYTSVESGGIASLNYAYIIFILPISIFSIALATAVFPKITSTINNGSVAETEKIYKDSISINLLLFIPITFVFFQFGDTIVRLAFERGKFIDESTTVTANALKCYSISLVFYSVYSVLNKMFYSTNMAKSLLVITIIGIFIKLIFNFLLVGDYQQYGLAVSTTLSYLFFFLISFILITKKLKIRNTSLFVKEFIFQLLNCLFCILIVKIIIESFNLFDILSQIVLLLFFVTAYLLNLFLLDHKSSGIFNLIKDKLNSIRILN